MILETFDKQPADVKDYDVNFSKWLPTGDTISTYTGSVTCLTDATDTALVINSQAATSQILKTWLSAGTSGKKYKVTVTIVTAGGRTQQDEFIIKVKDT